VQGSIACDHDAGRLFRKVGTLRLAPCRRDAGLGAQALWLVDRAGALGLARGRRVLRQLAQRAGREDLVDQVYLADQVLLHRRIDVAVGLAHVRRLPRQVLRIDLRRSGLDTVRQCPSGHTVRCTIARELQNMIGVLDTSCERA